jgi:acetate kinase
MNDLSRSPATPSILTVNGGSSSIKFVLYQSGGPLKRSLQGKIDRIGSSGTNLTFTDPALNRQGTLSVRASDHRSASEFLIDWLEKQLTIASITAVGHRVVHGMNHSVPTLVTQELLDELQRIRPYDPDHLPREIEVIEAFRRRHPRLPQVPSFTASTSVSSGLSRLG